MSNGNPKTVASIIISIGLIWFVLTGFNPMIIFYSLLLAAVVFVIIKNVNKKKPNVENMNQSIEKPIQQNVYIQGDNITKTEVKDSILNRSKVGGGSSKIQELEKLSKMKDKGTLDATEFKQMKKEILGK